MGHPAALGKALRHVLQDPTDATIVARRGRVRVAAHGVHEVVRLHDELYRSALEVR